jgi:hypothetical protein
MMDDSYARLRARQDRRLRAWDTPRSPSQSPAFVGQVFASRTVPATTGCFYSVHPVTVLGTEGESNPGSLTVDTTSTVLVYVMGGRPPVAGDTLVCRFLGNRWVADPLAQNGAGVVIAGCACTAIPNSLSMSSSDPSSNNGMFQNCTLQYGATPSQYAGLTIGAQSYLSTASFTDQFNNSFRYYFYCQGNQFFLTRVYVNSIFGSPFEDTVRYTWTTGSSGNSCSPFLLCNGQIYAGGDATCTVTISA